MTGVFSKLNRTRGQTPTKTNINFFVDPEEESRDNDATTDRLGTNQSDLEGSANCKCSCCEVDDTQREQMRGLPCKKFNKCMCFQLEGCRYQFLREREYGLVRAPVEHLGTFAKTFGCRFGSW